MTICNINGWVYLCHNDNIYIVINTNHNKFELSNKAKELLNIKNKYDINKDILHNWKIRCDPNLVEIVDTLKNEANGGNCKLEIKIIPREAVYTESITLINNYGYESILINQERIALYNLIVEADSKQHIKNILSQLKKQYFLDY
jgi:hypothetical protein